MTMQASDEFSRRTDPFRRELLAHCYRMLGSVHDAEDLVQETFLRAWRSYGQFDERRASLRTWLYRIATNACLTALEQRGRRALPSELAGPSAEAEWPLREPRDDVPWLQPIPDVLLEGDPSDPAAIVAARGSVRLALIAALQHLLPRQRAVLILRDVLAWRAAEVAELLGTSTAAVNSALQRARAQLAEATPVEEQIAEPGDAEQRQLLDRYVTAFVNADVASLTGLLREDVELEMPPYPTWFGGRHAVESFLAARLGAGDRWRMVLTAANGQPAAATYLRRRDGVLRAHAIHVLTVTGSGIARIVAFVDERLFPTFGLPLEFASGPGGPSTPGGTRGILRG